MLLSPGVTLRAATAIALFLHAACDVRGPFSGFDATLDASPVPREWIARFGGLGDDSGASSAVAPNGDVILTGAFSDVITLGGPAVASSGGTDIWVARYRADGTFVWSTRFGGAGADRAHAVAVDGNGDVYVVGDFESPVDFGGGVRGPRGEFLVKVGGSSGAYQWDRVLEASRYMFVFAAVGLGADSIAIGGYFAGVSNFGGGPLVSTPSTSSEGFIAVFGAAFGEHRWSRVFTSSGEFDDFGSIAAVDSDLIVTGGFTGTAMLGGAPLQAAGETDLFLARYQGSDGAHQWSVRKGGAGSERPGSLTTNGTYVFVGGGLSGRANLGGADLPTMGISSAFVAAYNLSDAAHVWSQSIRADYVAGTASLAASSTKLATTINFEGDLSIGTQKFTSPLHVVIVRFAPATGEPRAVVPFEKGDFNIGGAPDLSYAGEYLIGAGTFSDTARLFGAELTSAGAYDVAAFHLDF